MTEPEKTVFISYRRSTSKDLAGRIFDHLHLHNYDVFLDVNSIDSGMFDTVILNQIAARAHFLVLLSPGALKRCINPDDWLRREIEEALHRKRNIVPLIDEGFDFEMETAYLPEAWREVFKRYNSLRLPHDYFDAGMEKLRSRFLKQPVYDIVLTPTPPAERAEVERRIRDMVNKLLSTKEELSTEQYARRGLVREAKRDYDAAIADYTEVIGRKPTIAEAYYNRGNVLKNKGDYDAAIADYTEAIRLKPKLIEAYYNRGLMCQANGYWKAAIADFQKYLDLGGGRRYNDKMKIEKTINDLQKMLK